MKANCIKLSNWRSNESFKYNKHKRSHSLYVLYWQGNITVYQMLKVKGWIQQASKSFDSWSFQVYFHKDKLYSSNNVPQLLQKSTLADKQWTAPASNTQTLISKNSFSEIRTELHILNQIHLAFKDWTLSNHAFWS